MAKLKNLSTCKPSEFLQQTNKIRKAVSKWLTDTDIMNIRKHQPVIPDDATAEEAKEIIDKQGMKNFNDMLDAIMEVHPDETLELLALMSFVDPKDVDKHTVSEYLGSLNEVLADKNVRSFFTSLIAVANKLG